MQSLFLLFDNLLLVFFSFNIFSLVIFYIHNFCDTLFIFFFFTVRNFSFNPFFKIFDTNKHFFSDPTAEIIYLFCFGSSHNWKKKSQNLQSILGIFLTFHFHLKLSTAETAALPYFFGPVGILLGINVILFTWTAYTKCREVKQAFEAQNERTGKKKKKYQLYLKNVKQSFKLFLTMGLCWLAEVISWAIGGPRYIWITTDVINTLQVNQDSRKKSYFILKIKLGAAYILLLRVGANPCQRQAQRFSNPMWSSNLPVSSQNATTQQRNRTTHFTKYDSLNYWLLYITYFIKNQLYLSLK